MKFVRPLLQSLYDQLKWLVAPKEMAELQAYRQSISISKKWFSQAFPIAEDVLDYVDRQVNSRAVHPHEHRELMFRRYGVFTSRDVKLIAEVRLRMIMRHGIPDSDLMIVALKDLEKRVSCQCPTSQSQDHVR